MAFPVREFLIIRSDSRLFIPAPRGFAVREMKVKTLSVALSAGVLTLGWAQSGGPAERLASPVPENAGAARKTDAGLVTPVDDPTSVETANFRKKIEDAFEAGRFEELEEIAAGARKNKEVFDNGSWKIVQFYSALEGNDDDQAQVWEARERRHRKWIEARPDSVTAHVAYAGFFKGYAWFARGNGWASTVTDDGWKRFSERLDSAAEELKIARSLAEKDPYWWRVAMAVALGQGWDKERFDALLNEGWAFAPAFWGYDVARAHSLLPRWLGEPGDWEKFAEVAAARPGGLGAEIYARIVIAQSSYFKNIFRESQASWPSTRKGFDALRKKYPRALAIVAKSARIARLAEDRAYAREAFDELDGRYVRGVWPSEQAFISERDWAYSPE